MKIGINTLFYIPGEVGGSETYLLEILRVWKKEKIPHEVVLFTQDENRDRLASEFAGEGWSVVHCEFQAANRVVRILREQMELPWRVKKAGIDVLWSPGYTLPLFSGCRQAVTIHDMQYRRFPQDLAVIARMTTGILVQAGCIRADNVLTISEFAKQEILELTRAKEHKIDVTLEAVHPDFRPIAGDGGGRDSAPYLLCVANTYPHKNVGQLVRAFAMIQDQIPHELHVIGKPRLGESDVQEALTLVRDKNRVVRRSGLRRSELVEAYTQSSLFIFPSLYEGFGLPVLEALMAGVPVLTTRCGSIPEVGGDVVTYYNHEQDQNLSEAILKLLEAYSHPEARTDFKRKAKQHCRMYSWERCAEGVLAGLTKLDA